MIDLEEKYINFIKITVTKFVKDFELFLFGSRAKLKILFEFENSTLPYQVDVVDLKTVSDDFKSLIGKDLIKL